MQHIKCVVVGDGFVGKTCLLKCFSENAFPDDYVPTIYDNFKTTVNIDGRSVELGLWDTAGQEGYDRIRPLSYPQTDVFLVCFSLVERASYINIPGNWIPEIRHYNPDTPLVLVGTKLDIRQNQSLPNRKHVDKRNSAVSNKEGWSLAREIHAVKYVECSAKTQEGVTDVFYEATKAVLFPPIIHRKNNTKCVIL